MQSSGAARLPEQESAPQAEAGAFLGASLESRETVKGGSSKTRRHTSSGCMTAEAGYPGGSTQVKEAVHKMQRVNQEVFMPLVHEQGRLAGLNKLFTVAKITEDLRKFRYL